jgi:hypothetical protein
MPATEKLLVLLNPREKSGLSRQATRHGISMGEVVRRAIARVDPGDERELAQQAALIDGLVKALEQSTARAGVALDQALRDVAEARAVLAATDAGAPGAQPACGVAAVTAPRLRRAGARTARVAAAR